MSIATWTLEQLFGRMAELGREKLAGSDAEGEWIEERFTFELRLNGKEPRRWIMDARDSQRVMRPGAQVGDDIAIGLDADPRAAIMKALNKLGLLTEDGISPDELVAVSAPADFIEDPDPNRR